MPRQIVILSGVEDAPHLARFAQGCGPGLMVQTAGSLEALERVVTHETRLISFLTDVIVPGRLLDRLSQEPYNIHPGPPEYPGAHPEIFAIWENAARYGVTAHQMTAHVDTGPIVRCERFSIPPGIARRDLGDLAMTAAVKIFAEIAAHCAACDGPMRRTDETWRGPRRTRADLARLLATRGSMSPKDAARLDRAAELRRSAEAV